jgi:thiosulfate/3-mercaptopyruvate sulfurtransferase
VKRLFSRLPQKEKIIMTQQTATTAMQDAQTLSKFLMDTETLEDMLGTAGVLVFDCAVIAGPNPDTENAKSHPFAFKSGRQSYEAGHIPGAGFIDILLDLSDQSADHPLMLPSPEHFTNVMRRYGIHANSKVILYSSTEPMWAARAWWMLRAFGFDGAVILNGGLKKWGQENRAISQDVCAYPPGDFTAKSQPGLFANKTDVLAATSNTNSCIINALPPAIHTGSGGPVFGRKGRIASSVNVPTGALHNPDTGLYRPEDQLRDIFARVGANKADKIITYCGGGIASSNDAFALAMLGYTNVSVYDASMFEWGNDPSLPMETG